jgi:hypothetical protein
MMVSADQGPQRQHSAATRTGVRVADASAVLAIFAVLLYAMLRIAYTRFYGPLGLTPDDLGLGYAQLLAQSALGAVALLSLSLAAVATVVAMAVGMTHLVRQDRLSLPIAAPRWVGQVLWLAVGALAGVGSSVWALSSDPPAWAIAVMSPAFAAALVVGIDRVRRGLAGELTIRAKPTRAWWRAGVLATLIAVGLITTTVLSRQADVGVLVVQGGGAVHPSLLHTRIISWGADAATLTWTTNPSDRALRSLAGRCLLHLGQFDGTLFLYSPSAHPPATYRVPAALAVVRILPNARCSPTGHVTTSPLARALRRSPPARG